MDENLTNLLVSIHYVKLINKSLHKAHAVQWQTGQH